LYGRKLEVSWNDREEHASEISFGDIGFGSDGDDMGSSFPPSLWSGGGGSHPGAAAHGK
jgi:hypothetical protein